MSPGAPNTYELVYVKLLLSVATEPSPFCVNGVIVWFRMLLQRERFKFILKHISDPLCWIILAVTIACENETPFGAVTGLPKIEKREAPTGTDDKIAPGLTRQSGRLIVSNLLHIQAYFVNRCLR